MSNIIDIAHHDLLENSGLTDNQLYKV
ncbi:MAG: hypothetical protein ACD_69C00188G0001, partial [uncultured bacterium]